MKSRAATAEPEPLPFVLVAIERLADTIDRETRDLNGQGAIEYRVHSQRKSQSLMELARLEPALVAVRGDPRLRGALADLLGKLEVNKRLLHARLRAARTIADIVAKAIAEGQSDGTYSAHAWRENRR